MMMSQSSDNLLQVSHTINTEGAKSARQISNILSHCEMCFLSTEIDKLPSPALVRSVKI